MLESDFLIYDRRAGAWHIRVALVFAILLGLAGLIIFPHRLVLLPRISQFIPVIDTMHLLFCGIIATVLFSLASVLRSGALIALGTGYVFVALIAVAHALTYPNTFSPTGLLGANYDTVTWLYMAWHVALPVAIMAYIRLRESPHRLHHPVRDPGGTIFSCILLAVLGAAGVTWLATAGDHFLYAALNPTHSDRWQILVVPLSGLVIAILWRGHRSILDIGLMLTMWAWLLEYLVALPGAQRFSIGWYAGRMIGLVAGIFVLLLVLIELTRLYARTVVLITSQKRERQNRQLLGEAVGAYITHELRQPLAAISLNAYTAQQLNMKSGSELSAVMDDLVRDSRRASEILEQTRAIFEIGPDEKRPTDLNQLIRDTLLLTSGQLKSREIQVVLKLQDHLPLATVNPTQMQQVFLNLFLNAAEALGEVQGRPRRLTIGSASGDVGIVIRVEDNGPSITEADQGRIFDPFFTTKPHGMGMGLSICRSVLIAHGGSIQVTPETPSGVCFEIFLPNGGDVRLAPA